MDVLLDVCCNSLITNFISLNYGKIIKSFNIYLKQKKDHCGLTCKLDNKILKLVSNKQFIINKLSAFTKLDWMLRKIVNKCLVWSTASLKHLSVYYAF